MLFGATEILICLVPVFVVIAIVGLTLIMRNRKN